MMILKLKKKTNFTYRHKSPSFLKDVDIEKVLVSAKISSGEKTISALLVTCIIIIKLNHYIKGLKKTSNSSTQIGGISTF